MINGLQKIVYNAYFGKTRLNFIIFIKNGKSKTKNEKRSVEC